MSAPSPPHDRQEIHWLQRLFENIWFLLIVGLLVPTVFYTFWSVLDLLILPRFGDDPPHAGAPAAVVATVSETPQRLTVQSTLTLDGVTGAKLTEATT